MHAYLKPKRAILTHLNSNLNDKNKKGSELHEMPGTLIEQNVNSGGELESNLKFLKRI